MWGWNDLNAAKKLSDEAGWHTAVRASPDNFLPLPKSSVTEQGLVLTDRPNGEAIAAAVVEHVVAIRIEGEAPRAVRAIGVE